ENYGAIVLCHNFQGYDSYPILKYLYTNGILPNVDILRRCALRFRQDCIHITGVDPFKKSLIPSYGYNPAQVQSMKALQWLKYQSHAIDIRIQHARNGGEKVIGPYKVDGYYEANCQKVVLKFHGDFWHENPKMYVSSTLHPVSKLTMDDLYQKTLDKQKYLEDRGYVYQSIWESEFEQQMKNNQEMAAFVHDLEHVTQLQPRDAFFGGRTEAFTLFKERSWGETLNCYDVTSLYPFINKTEKIPLGHPTIIAEDFKGIDNYEGLIKCKASSFPYYLIK
ncbi:hypothetical protein MAR_035315, partial [Mya arenaria]